MDGAVFRVVRVFNNNALLVRSGDSQRVVVGRGIGYGRRVGDEIGADAIQRQYVEVSPDRLHFLESIDSLGPGVDDAVSSSVELAADVLGELHPSVYLLLADHLVFAVRRLGEGESIRNELLGEIRAVFPTEFEAATLVVHYLNSRLGIELPQDEAAFIALHLNAARRGVTVKQPLEQANAVARIIADVTRIMGVSMDSEEASDSEVISHIVRLIKRVQSRGYRRNKVSGAIYRQLPTEIDLAERILRRIANVEAIPEYLEGEVAFLAMFLHGWQQSIDHRSRGRKDYT